MTEKSAGNSHQISHGKRLAVVFAIFFAVISMAVVGIATASHLKWMASPEKAFLDALEYSSVTPATYTVATNDLDAVVSFDGEKQAMKGTYKSVAFYAVVVGRMLYVKSSTPNELVKLFIPQNLPDNLRPIQDAITQRVTDKWISMSLDRLPSPESSQSKFVTCLINTDAQLQTNNQAKKELTKLYESNKFLAIEKASATDKSNKFNVSLKNESFDAFIRDMKSGPLYTSLKSDCESTVRQAENLANQADGATAEVLLSKSKNALQKATFTKNGESTQIDVRYGDVGTITVPNDSIPYDSITSSVMQTMIQAYLGANQ